MNRGGFGCLCFFPTFAMQTTRTMKKLAILCALACVLVACEKPMNEEAGEKKFTQAVQKDLDVLNGTFVRIGSLGEIIEDQTLTFTPFSQPIAKTGSKSGEVLDFYGTYNVNYYFYIKPASNPKKSELVAFHIMEENTDYYDENYSKINFYYTIVDKDTIVIESIHPVDAFDQPRTYIRK